MAFCRGNVKASWLHYCGPEEKLKFTEEGMAEESYFLPGVQGDVSDKIYTLERHGTYILLGPIFYSFYLFPIVHSIMNTPVN